MRPITPRFLSFVRPFICPLSHTRGQTASVPTSTRWTGWTLLEGPAAQDALADLFDDLDDPTGRR